MTSVLMRVLQLTMVAKLELLTPGEPLDFQFSLLFFGKGVGSI